MQDSSEGKTRLLVTHALHFLPQVDYIYTIAGGRIAERGTYAELMANNGEFSKFYKEFGSQEEQEEEKLEAEAEAIEETDEIKDADTKRKTAVKGAGMMQTEERNTGSISSSVYKEYLKAGNAILVLPVLLFSLVFVQGASVMASYW